MGVTRSAVLRRTLVGLVVLAVLFTSLGQAIAFPVDGAMLLPGAHHGEPQTLPTAAHAMHGAPGLPCHHDRGSHRLACCIAGDCSTLGHLLQVSVPAIPGAVPQAMVHQYSAVPARVGLRAAPAVPPPRRTV